MTIVLEELKLLLSLNGDQRLPHLEKEIFTNRCLTVYYLERLIIDLNEGTQISIIRDKTKTTANDLAWAVYIYSKYKIKDKWPIAEKFLSEDPHWYNCYYRHL